MSQKLQQLIQESLHMEAYGQAGILLNDYLQHNEKDSFYYYAKAQQLAGLEEYRSAIAILEEAVELGHGEPAFWELLAQTYMQTDEYSKAIPWLEECLEDDELEDELTVLFELGQCKMEQGQWTEALECFEDILLETDHPQTKLYTAICWENAGRLQRAEQYFHDLIFDEEWKGSVLAWISEKPDCMRLHHYLQLAGQDEWTNLGWTCRQQLQNGHLQEAMLQLEQMQSIRHDEKVLFMQILLEAEQQNCQKARELYSQLLETKPAESPSLAQWLQLRMDALLVLNYSEDVQAVYIDRLLQEAAGHIKAESVSL